MDERTKKELRLAARIRSLQREFFDIATVIKYINNQEAHHRKISFEEEFITLLKKRKIAFDLKFD